LALDLRIVFLFLLFLTGVLYTLYSGPALSVQELTKIILSFLLVPAAVGTVVVFGLLLTRTDPLPYIRLGAYEMSLRQNISFAAAIPAELQASLSVDAVEKEDTDGDGFDEWVVFYKFDLQSGNSPIKVIIYDSDRGNPPVIFPYNLRAPGRDYLAEDARSTTFTLADVTEDRNGAQGENIPEILVSDRNQLSIFRFQQNSEPWDFPRDNPPRYYPIGFFRGNIGATAAGTDRAVTFDEMTKNVTVIDRQNFERSQLAIRSVYQLNPVTNSYWDNLEPLGSNRQQNPVLAGPIVSTIDFFSGPPDDIFNSTFPEKIVLGFYTSTCGQADLTLCHNLPVEWQPADFLTGDALNEFNNGNSNYFGLDSPSGNQDISITSLRYYPQLEVDRDLLVTGPGRDVVTGEEPRSNIVQVNLKRGDNPGEDLGFEMALVNGHWKILRRVSILEPLAQETPSGINTTRP
jgi:hypothetical protein